MERSPPPGFDDERKGDVFTVWAQNRGRPFDLLAARDGDKENDMKTKSIFAAVILVGLPSVDPASAQIAADEQEFQQMASALRANDAERLSAIATCIEQGIGDNPEGAARFMGVPVEKAAEAWCTRMTNGIANGQLTLADVAALNEGTVTPGAQEVLTTMSEGK